MLYKQEIRKYVYLLLLLFLILQLIPNTYENHECFHWHAAKSLVTLPHNVSQLTRDNRNSACHLLSVDVYDNFNYTTLIDTSKRISFYQGLTIDFCKKIKQTIPHYFHGSKYKIFYS